MFDEKKKTHWVTHFVLNLTLNLYSSCPKDEEVGWMNVLKTCSFFRSLCDKARVAFNQPQVKGMAGSLSERMTKSTKKR